MNHISAHISTSDIQQVLTELDVEVTYVNRYLQNASPNISRREKVLLTSLNRIEELVDELDIEIDKWRILSGLEKQKPKS